MRTSQKIILSIVIAVVITGGFALIAYTGLFRLLEIDFFSSRVESDQKIKLRNISDAIVLWNEEILSRFDSLSRDRNIQSVFSISQRQEEIIYRAQLSDSLKDQLLGFNGIRIVDNAGRIQFSSFAGDISSQQPGVDSRILYWSWSETGESFELPIADENSIAVIYYDEVNQQIRYQLPIQDWGFVTRGWMIVYVGLRGLSDRLARNGLIAQGANLYIVEGRGIIADIRPEQAAAVKGEIDALWPIDDVPSDFSVLAKGLDEKYWLAGTIVSDGTWVGKLIPGHLFGFSAAMRMLILATVFLTSALLVFLFFNLHQDKTEVLRGRIRRLQINLLREWLEHHEDKKLSLKDFETRREEVRTELRGGLGKLKEDESAKANEIIDEGWTRIAKILAEKDFDAIGSSTAVKQESIDMKLLESMIARAISAAQTATAQIQYAQQPPQARGGEEASELAEELAEVEEIPEITEAGLEELSEVEEIPEIAEAEPEELVEEKELAELESDWKDLDDAGKQTTDERDGKDLAEGDSEVFEVLPVVLSDDFGELVELDKVKQSKIYMFDEPSDRTYERDSLEAFGEDDKGADDLEEIDESDTADKLDLKPG